MGGERLPGNGRGDCGTGHRCVSPVDLLGSCELLCDEICEWGRPVAPRPAWTLCPDSSQPFLVISCVKALNMCIVVYTYHLDTFSPKWGLN